MKMLRVFVMLSLILSGEAFGTSLTRSRRTSSVIVGVADEEILLVGDAAAAVTEEQQDLLASLRSRQQELEKGIGRRYRVRTQLGFLNVHSSYKDGPWATHNIVSQLGEGDIVTSTGSQIGDWIPHDGGGWSIAVFGGFTWLQPLEDQ
jgi:hypothetical protein